MDNNTLEKINEIRKNADIVDIISRHIQVIRKGRGYYAICPFHNDTNPSLSISKDKQIFKCFVCNEGGNVFSFLTKYKKIPYMQAVKEVADMVGIEFKSEVKKEVEVISLKTKVLYDIYQDATLFYQSSLASSLKAMEYCTNRNIDANIIKSFSLGYSPDSDKLINFLLAKGYKKEDLYKSGIALDVNGELKDRFAGRLIFPITDLNGKIVAFSGRIIEASDMAKYVNSPESDIFIKGNTLYNYATALQDIKHEKKMYICEGFMDCIALVRSGIKNAIALMGTAFTKEHLKILKYLGVSITLTLDADDPGNINANKLANELTSLEINTMVIPNYKDVKDLDEFYVKYGKDELVNYVKESEITPLDFSFYVASKLDALKNNENKKTFLKKMCKRIAKMSNEDADLYANKLHEELGFSLTTIQSLIKKEKENSKDDVITNVKNYVKLTKHEDLQLRILSSLLDSKEAIEIYIESFTSLNNDSYRKIANMISEYYYDNKDDFSIDDMLPNLYTKISIEQDDNNDLKDVLTQIDNSKENYPKYSKAAFEDLLYEIKEVEPLEQILEKINDNLKFENDLNRKKDLILEAIEIKKKIKEKKNQRGG